MCRPPTPDWISRIGSTRRPPTSDRISRKEQQQPGLYRMDQ
jgi:hypothetical protein